MNSPPNPNRWRNTFATASAILFIIAAVYVGSYVALSVNGQYAPAGYGLDGPKGYDWAPLGFHRDGAIFRDGQGVWLAAIYYPLWRLDRDYWHQGQGLS